MYIVRLQLNPVSSTEISDHKWWADARELASVLSTARNLSTIRPLLVFCWGAGTKAPTWTTCGLGVSEELGYARRR